MLSRAGEAFDQGDFARVIQMLPPELKQPEVRLLRARALIRAKNFKRAHRELKGLLRRLPMLRDLIRYLQAEALFGMKRYLKAANRFRDAARAKNSSWIDISWQRRADAFRAAGRHSRAIKEYRHILRVQPDHPSKPWVKLHLALSLARTGQRRNAAVILQQLWLQLPDRPVATRARKELDRLRASKRVRIKAPSLSQKLARVRRLTRRKMYAEAKAELLELRKRHRASADTAARLDMQRVTILLRENRAEEAYKILSAIPQRRKKYPPAWHLRRMKAKCLARMGKLDQAAKLLLKASYRPKGKLNRAQLAEVSRTARMLAEYGRYKEALKLYDRIYELSPGREGLELKRAWLAYRAGFFDLAVKRMSALGKRRAYGLFAKYWGARAHQRAKRPDRALPLYQELLKKHRTTYYGLVARSRLVEAGKLKLASSSTCAPGTTAPFPKEAQGVEARLSALITRHGDLYPALHRARTLWRMGMREDARRELRITAVDAAWIMARGRSKRYIVRPQVERLFRGGPPPRRRWNKRARKIYKLGVALRHDLGALLSAAGISYFGWRLGLKDPDSVRRSYPRAFPALVLKVARENKLDPHLIWAIMRTESHYRTDVISRVGATGLMQIMPTTGRLIAQAMDLKSFHPSKLFDPRLNLKMAGWYLRAVSDKLKGQIPLMASAYNGGPHNVARWLKMRGEGADLDEFMEEIPFSESRRYGKKILRLLALYERTYCAKDDRVAPLKLNTETAAEPWF